MNWCLLSALVFVGSIAGGPQRSPLRFDEMHHEYIGLGACAVGALTHSKFLTRVGTVIAVDDASEHLYQRLNNNLSLESPLSFGYQETLWQLRPVRDLNHWLDNALH